MQTQQTSKLHNLKECEDTGTKSSYDEGTILEKRSEISRALLGSCSSQMLCHHPGKSSGSVDYAVSMRLHFILEQLNSSGTYVHFLYVDFRLDV